MVLLVHLEDSEPDLDAEPSGKIEIESSVNVGYFSAALSCYP